MLRQGLNSRPNWVVSLSIPRRGTTIATRRSSRSSPWCAWTPTPARSSMSRCSASRRLPPARLEHSRERGEHVGPPSPRSRSAPSGPPARSAAWPPQPAADLEPLLARAAGAARPCRRRRRARAPRSAAPAGARPRRAPRSRPPRRSRRSADRRLVACPACLDALLQRPAQDLVEGVEVQDRSRVVVGGRPLDEVGAQQPQVERERHRFACAPRSAPARAARSRSATCRAARRGISGCTSRRSRSPTRRSRAAHRPAS